MSRLLGFVCLATILLLGAKPQNEMFAKYKSVEAYEIRPGILAMPRYTEDGQVCEIGVERRSYSPEMIRIEESFSQKEIDQIVDELAPPEERGPRSKDFPRDMTMLEGQTYTTMAVFEDVTIRTSGAIKSEPTRWRHFRRYRFTTTYNVAFTIQWTKRKCQ